MSGQSRREIVFSARDNGVSDLMSRLRQSANELGREMIREAMSNSSNAKDAVKYYEQQIRLLEKKTKLEAQTSRMQLDSRYEAAKQGGGDSSKLTADYKSQVADLQRGGREDAIQVDLLRELIDTVKTTSNQEIKSEDKNSMRETSRSDRAFLASAGEEFTSLSDQMVSEGGGATSKSGGGRSRGADIAGTVQRAASSGDSVSAVNSVLEQANDFEVLGTSAGVITSAIGVGVAALHIRAQREQSASMMAALTGSNVDDVLAKGMGGTNFGGYGAGTLGVSKEDFLSQNMPTSMRARGTNKDAEVSALKALEVERGLGVDGGTVTSLQRLTRVMEGSASSQEMATKVYSSMYGTGALGQDNQDMSRMQDIMSGFASFQESQFMRAGVTDSTATLGMMKKLQGLGGNFQRDDYAFDTINRLNSGLTSGGSPEAQAIKMDVLRRANPNKSYFELQMQQEEGINSKGYLSGMFDYVKGTGGDLNSQSLLFDQLTGGSMKKKDIWSLMSGTKSLDDIDEQIKQQDPNYKKRAIDASSGAQTELLNFTESFKDVMSPIGEGVEQLIKKLQTVIKMLDE